MTTARFPSSVVERFMRYVQIDTRSDENSTSCPSTPGQWDLLRLLRDEAQALGLQDVTLDDNGYMFATVPASAGCEHLPAIGFIAHVDTSPEVSGQGVRPILHKAYDGADIVLPEFPHAPLSPNQSPRLTNFIGGDIITTSGDTLLGADDKAGVAEIMGAAEVLMKNPDLPRPRVRIGFTPDEEIGRGAHLFDVKAFDAAFAYTLDGGYRGELECESFSADAITFTFRGQITHPGYAFGRMRNAIKVAADFVSSLPEDGLSPETTTGREGFVHPYKMQAAVDETTVVLLIRDFDNAKLAAHQTMLRELADSVIARHPGSNVEVSVVKQYRNMREKVEEVPAIMEIARTAYRLSGIEPHETVIRGGTDGSQLSFMGLPCPNLFAGQQNIHSRFEWIACDDLNKAVEVIVNIAATAAATDAATD
jgi:tripeptide aminopeptidase